MKILGNIIIVVSSCEDGGTQAHIESNLELSKLKDTLHNALQLLENAPLETYSPTQYTM